MRCLDRRPRKGRAAARRRWLVRLRRLRLPWSGSKPNRSIRGVTPVWLEDGSVDGSSTESAASRSRARICDWFRRTPVRSRRRRPRFAARTMAGSQSWSVSVARSGWRFVRRAGKCDRCAWMATGGCRNSIWGTCPCIPPRRHACGSSTRADPRSSGRRCSVGCSLGSPCGGMPRWRLPRVLATSSNLPTLRRRRARTARPSCRSSPSERIDCWWCAMDSVATCTTYRSRATGWRMSAP